jgi:hypothetical protein
MFVCFSIHRFAKEGEMLDINKTPIVVCQGLKCPLMFFQQPFLEAF